MAKIDSKRRIQLLNSAMKGVFMVESIAKLGALVQENLSFAVVYSAYLYALHRVYRWLPKRPPVYIRKDSGMHSPDA